MRRRGIVLPVRVVLGVVGEGWRIAVVQVVEIVLRWGGVGVADACAVGVVVFWGLEVVFGWDVGVEAPAVERVWTFGTGTFGGLEGGGSGGPGFCGWGVVVSSAAGPNKGGLFGV